MMLALLGSTELPEIGHALEKLRVPAKLVQLLLMTVRYIDVLGREYRRLRAAMTVRGFQMRSTSIPGAAMGYLFGMLFVRSFERAERISAAMRCRGFTGGSLCCPKWRWRAATPSSLSSPSWRAGAVVGSLRTRLTARARRRSSGLRRRTSPTRPDGRCSRALGFVLRRRRALRARRARTARERRRSFI